MKRSVPSLQTIGMARWPTFPFTIPPIPQVFRTFYSNVGSEWLNLILLFNSKVIAICLLQKVSDFCLTVTKNHITVNITESI